MRMRAMLLTTAAVALVAAGTIGVLSAGARGGKPATSVFAVMTGGKEVDATGERGTGDRNGRGSFSATFDGNELCYGLVVKNIDNPAAAHIHRGNSRTAGPVVQELDPPEDGDPGASSECVRLSRSLARAIRLNPSAYYVNVHNADFPNGAVRGQLFGRNR
jgi:CHRD domain